MYSEQGEEQMITMKFGGTSVGSIEAIQNVVDIVQNAHASDPHLAIVLSAMGGVTDDLVRSVQYAIDGNRWGYRSTSDAIRDRHEDVANHLLKAGPRRRQTLETIHRLLDYHLELCDAILILGEATPRIRDAVVSLGERMSSPLLAAILAENGLPAAPYYAGEFIVTTDEFQAANPIWDLTERRIQQNLRPVIEEGTVPVITGFLGATPDGHVTTLGRGGSDYSAAIFAAYLESDELIIWTDVDGVMTTDPRLDRRARVLPYVSYVEVGELAFYGAKVLHPKTVQPIITRRIPLIVRNTFNPAAPGTRIGADMQPSEQIIKAVTSVRHVSMLTITGRGMLGVPGIAGRTFLATAQAGANVMMISQSSSEQSFCFTVIEEQALRVKEAIEAELASEIAVRDVDSVDVMDDIAIITVIGAGMRQRPGVAGRVFTTLGAEGVNVLAIAQGSSECSISFVVQAMDHETAVMRLHELALTRAEDPQI